MRIFVIGAISAAAVILPSRVFAECSLSMKAVDCSRVDMDCEHGEILAKRIGTISGIEISQELERKPLAFGEAIKGTYFLKGPNGEHIQLQATMKCTEMPY
jgi:hypothetical protein